MPYAIARLDLVDRAGAIFVKAIGLGDDAVEILAAIPERIIIDLDFKSRDDGFPGWVARIEVVFLVRPRLQGGRASPRSDAESG